MSICVNKKYLLLFYAIVCHVLVNDKGGGEVRKKWQSVTQRQGGFKKCHFASGVLFEYPLDRLYKLELPVVYKNEMLALKLLSWWKLNKTQSFLKVSTPAY